MPYDSYYAFKEIRENPILLDFSGNPTLGQIHQLLKKKFGLPEYYGENWSALWDCLRYLWTDGEEVLVELHGFLSLKDEMQAACQPMLEVFSDVHEESPNVRFVLVS